MIKKMFLNIQNSSSAKVVFQYDSPDFFWVTLHPLEGMHLFSVKLSAGFAYKIEDTTAIMPASIEAKLSDIRKNISFSVSPEGRRSHTSIPLLERKHHDHDTSIQALIAAATAANIGPVDDGTRPVWDEKSYHNL